MKAKKSKNENSKKLVFRKNYKADVDSVKEHYDPKNHATGWADYDLEAHKVPPPDKYGKDCPEEKFIREILRLVNNYIKKLEKSPLTYSTFDENCSAWVNSILREAGVDAATRINSGEFNGADAGEEEDIPSKYFEE